MRAHALNVVTLTALGLALAGLCVGPAFAGGWGGRYGAAHDEEAHGASSYSQSSASGYGGYEDHGDAGYHRYGGGVSQTTEVGGAWRYRIIEDGRECWRPGEPPWRARDHARLPACGGSEEVLIPASFFDGAGGVGGFPESYSSGGGGGVVFAGASAGAGAHAFASASASVSIRGGFRGGGHRGGGHKGGGCGCKH